MQAGHRSDTMPPAGRTWEGTWPGAESRRRLQEMGGAASADSPEEAPARQPAAGARRLIPGNRAARADLGDFPGQAGMAVSGSPGKAMQEARQALADAGPRGRLVGLRDLRAWLQGDQRPWTHSVPVEQLALDTARHRVMGFQHYQAAGSSSQEQAGQCPGSHPDAPAAAGLNKYASRRIPASAVERGVGKTKDPARLALVADLLYGKRFHLSTCQVPGSTQSRADHGAPPVYRERVAYSPGRYAKPIVEYAEVEDRSGRAQPVLGDKGVATVAGRAGSVPQYLDPVTSSTFQRAHRRLCQDSARLTGTLEYPALSQRLRLARVHDGALTTGGRRCCAS